LQVQFLNIFLSSTLVWSNCIVMPLKVSEHIQQWLAEVINDLRDAVEQEAAKAYLISIFNIKSVKFESEAELCNNS